MAFQRKGKWARFLSVEFVLSCKEKVSEGKSRVVGEADISTGIYVGKAGGHPGRWEPWSLRAVTLLPQRQYVGKAEK